MVLNKNFLHNEQVTLPVTNSVRPSLGKRNRTEILWLEFHIKDQDLTGFDSPL